MPKVMPWEKARNGHRWSGNVPTQSLTLVRRLNALKAGRAIVSAHVDAVLKRDMEVDIHVQCTTKTLYQCYGTGRAILKRISRFVDQMGRDCAVNDTQSLAHGLGMAPYPRGAG